MTIRPICLMINTGNKSNMKKAAIKGAAIAGGVYTATTIASWISSPNEMCQKVKEYGGKQKYAASLLLGMAILAAGNALLNMTIQAIYNKTHS